MHRSLLGWVVLALAAAVLFAQPRDARPAFEAANLKPDTTRTSSSSHSTPGQLLISNRSIKQLVEGAFGAKPYQVTGPDWMQDIHFDLSGKYPSDSKPADRPAMLRTLLEDRFKLAVHHESKELPGYALMPAKGGFKLKPVEPGPNSSNINGGAIVTWKATRMSMADVAELLARYLKLLVVDKSAIEGVYDFEVRWSEDDNSRGVDAAAARFDALTEAIAKVGLRLQAQKVPVDLIVVDHVERAPSEN